MDAMTTQQASHDLDGLIDRVIDNVQPTILCNDKGNKAVLMSLDEFSSWQKNCIYCQIQSMQKVF
jgi:antitoxin YefM